MFWNKISYGKNMNILFNYDANFYCVIKISIVFVLKLHDLFWIIYDTYEDDQTLKNNY